ncbi:putative speedy protein E13 [Aotus nancymaae]|uniref:putative speedy protein E13 n=1 Tax=Aotus nancymaae TaxID=37293 RepID=UPI0030FE2971
MAGCQPQPQLEERSPQTSTSGYSLLEVIDDEVLGPSAPWVDSSPPNFFCWQKKREWSDESEEELEEGTEKECAPEPEETWVVDTLSSLKMKLKRRRVSPVLPEHYEGFNMLLEDPVVKRFLAWDKDLRASDKYLLAMVIAYFGRARLSSWQYQRIHFFLALYLANDMEEDDEGPKQAIFYFLYGKNCSQRLLFQKLRFQFFRSMRCRAWVSLEELEEIQAYDPEHWVWARNRALLS